MERRTFVQASVASLCTAGAAGAANSKPAAPEMYELRTYILLPSKLPLIEDYFGKALIPALRRFGVGPVGAFAEAPEKVKEKETETETEKEIQRATLLIVHGSADSALAWPAKLAADGEYLRAAAPYLSAKANDPAYLRIESSLLAAIGGMPKLEKPDPSKPRLFNLRVYENPSERAAAKKVEMFEKAELAIFRGVGLNPVFFASARVGQAMPNLTYMLVFPDDATRKTAWDKFKVNPDWLNLKAIPEYADKELVSKITNRILTPLAGSEI